MLPPTPPSSTLGGEILKIPLVIAARSELTLQWVTAQRGIEGNERTDVLAKQAAALPQDTVPWTPVR